MLLAQISVSLRVPGGHAPGGLLPRTGTGIVVLVAAAVALIAIGWLAVHIGGQKTEENK
jgi:hypothetical protein